MSDQIIGEKKNVSVLVVDDETELREFTEEVLSRDGYTVISARDGEEAWDLYRRKAPDVVLTDINMPKMEGTELLRRIKDKDSDQIVMMFSSFDKPVESLRLGADDYLSKPIKQHELIHRLRVNIEAADARRRLARIEKTQQMINYLDAEWRSFGSHEYNTKLNGLQALLSWVGDEIASLQELQFRARKALDLGKCEELVDELSAVKLSDAKDFLEMAGMRIEQLIREGRMFRDYYQLDAEALQLKRIEISALFRLFAEEAAALLKRYHREDLSLDIDFGGAEEAQIEVDPGQFVEKVLLELFTNACRHTEGGRIEIKAVGNRWSVEISVSDNGDGIEEKYWDKLFLPRGYAHSYLNHSSIESNPLEYGKSGHGMGLAMARRFVELCRGSIGFESRFRDGSRFWVRLPHSEA